MNFSTLQSKRKAKEQTDGTLELRNATASAQEKCFIVVALTNPGSTQEETVDVTLVLRLNGGISFSVPYQMSVKDNYSQNEILLDDLLTKAYEACDGWVTGNATFEVYVGNKFVGELPLRLTMRSDEVVDGQ